MLLRELLHLPHFLDLSQQVFLPHLAIEDSSHSSLLVEAVFPLVRKTVPVPSEQKFNFSIFLFPNVLKNNVFTVFNKNDNMIRKYS